MSCTLNVLSKVEDIQSVKGFLFPQSQEYASESDALDDVNNWADNDWGWTTVETTSTDDDESKMDARAAWLQSCVISVSPLADTIVLAKGKRFIILNDKWEKNSLGANESKFLISFKGCISENESDVITSVLCLPLASQKRSNHGGADWTAIIVGMTTGYVNIYTENGVQLLSQIFSLESVVKIKCCTYKPARHPRATEQHEEVTILYNRSLVIIDGFSFYQTIKACRNHVARATASGTDLMAPPPLSYKKWSLKEQEQSADHISAGLIVQNPFDQMQTASMIGGFNAPISANSPPMHRYLSAGVGPYVGFFYAVEGTAQPMLADVAHAVATKLKSALYTQINAASQWFGFKGQGKQSDTKEKVKPKIEPATSLPLRYGLCDKRRIGESISVSPNNQLIATTDSFGRVMIVDVCKGLVLRMWKGYRDAQVGWINVTEDCSIGENRDEKPVMRQVQFLVIYAPRRGIMEVWASQQGPRVAAFNVDKNCMLVNSVHGLMGLNNVTYRSSKVQVHQCFLIGPDATVSIVDVPFHLALSDKNNKRARDMHLFKKIKIYLKESKVENDTLMTELIKFLADIKTSSIKKMCLERVIKTDYLSPMFIHKLIQSVLEQLLHLDNSCKENRTLNVTKEIELGNSGESESSKSSEKQSSLDYESRVLLSYCNIIDSLISTFSKLSQLNNTSDRQTSLTQNLSSVLHISENDLRDLKNHLDHYEKVSSENKPSSRVSFEQDSAPLKLVEFLTSFSPASLSDSFSEIVLADHKNNESLKKLAKFMFQNQLEYGLDSQLNEILSESRIQTSTFISILLQLFISEEKCSISSSAHLKSLLFCLTSFKGDFPEDNKWNEKAYQECINTFHIVPATILALVCQSLSIEAARHVESITPKTTQLNQPISPTSSTDDPTISDDMRASVEKLDLSEWESLSIEQTQWSTLYKQLQHVLVLNTFLNSVPHDYIKHDRIASPPDNQNVVCASVKMIVDGGPGLVAELIGKWFSNFNVCEQIGPFTEPAKPEAITDSQVSESLAFQSSIFSEQLRNIHQLFPYSVTNDSVLSNASWEFSLSWSKCPEEIVKLEYSLKYLKHINNSILQRGICCMIWQMFLLKKFSSASYLIEKVSKAPKERLCRRDVGIGDVTMEKFISISSNLLNIIMQSGYKISTKIPETARELLWCSSEELNAQGASSLVDLALDQKEPNFELVQLYYNLSVILHAILAFNMKSIKPLSLFSPKEQNLFFQPLSTIFTSSSHSVDETLVKHRLDFMCRVISCSVQQSALSVEQQGSAASIWPRLMLKLATYFDVDTDVLRLNHAVSLYAHGLDTQGQEILLTVQNHEEVCAQLLIVAGQRIKYYIYEMDPQGTAEKISACPPTLSHWIKELDLSDFRADTVSLNDTSLLIGQIISRLEDGQSECTRSLMLLDFIQTFI